LRQSPASSIPPVLPDLKEDTIRFVLRYYFFSCQNFILDTQY
jgi:hypothetical protein